METVKKIKGRKINLRWITVADAMSIYKYAGDKAISRYTFIPHPYTLQNAHDFIKTTKSDRRKNAGYHFGLENPENGQIIGMVGLQNIKFVSRCGELGYWLGKPFWGKGIMSEAIHLMLRFCFFKVKLHRVQAYVFPANEASVRLLEKVGLKREGLLRERFAHRGDYADAYLYAILEDEWARQDLPPDSLR